jgi:hypothetical protein
MLQRGFQGRTKAPFNKPDIFKQSRYESRRLVGQPALAFAFDLGERARG